MKLLIKVLLLFTVFNQILARSLLFDRRDQFGLRDFFDDDNFDPFHQSKYSLNEEFYKFKTYEKSEESKEFIKPSAASAEEIVGGFFDNLLGSFLEITDDTVESNEMPKKNSQEHSAETEGKDDGIHSIMVELFTSAEQDEKVKSSSEEKETEKEKVKDKSSEETSYWKIEESREEDKEKSLEKVTFNDKNKSQEDSDEKPLNMEVEIIDLIKSSEEEKQDKDDREDKSKETENKDSTEEEQQNKKDSDEIKATDSNEDKGTGEDYALTESDVNELVTLYITLHYLDNLMGGKVEKEEFEKEKEVDEILAVIALALDGMTEEDMAKKKEENKSKEKEDSNESEVFYLTKSTTKKPDSNEDSKSSEEIITTTKSTPSNSNESKDEENENGDENKSNSNENEDELNFVSIVLQEADTENEQHNLNDHKYSIIESPSTSAPFRPVTAATSLSAAHNSINKYSDIRENLDTQQNNLQKHELDMDKDFYAIISNNYDDESLNKFENDIFVVHENLDRIKRNINAMQSLQSKLYFHKLVTSAVKEAQEKASK